MNPAAEPDRLARAPPGWSSPVAVTSRMRKRGNNGSTRVSDEQWQSWWPAACWPISGCSARRRAPQSKRTRRPNILLILVDEMRFPSVFPGGVSTPDQYLAQYMPNLFHLWQHGVKFESYYGSGNACSPARATIKTGLYPHQQWLLATRTRHLAVAPDGLSDVREVAAQVRISNSVHREMASFGCARRRKPRWVSRRLRIPGDDQSRTRSVTTVKGRTRTGR